MGAKGAIILTGAAGGVGMDACRTLAERGYIVYAGAIDDWEYSRVEQLAASMPEVTIRPVMLDLRRAEHIAAVVELVSKDGVRLAGLVLNGGASPHGVPVEDTSVDLLRDVFETNAIGNYTAVKTALPLLKRDKGRIIFVGSASTYAPPPLELPYVASKAALASMADSMRREFRNTGIKVVLLVPGIIQDTFMGANLHWATRQSLARIRNCPPEQIDPTQYDRGGNTALMQPAPSADPFYEGMYQGQMTTISKGIKTGFPPSLVTADIIRGLELHNPRPVYLQGIYTKIFAVLRWGLPLRTLDRIIVKLGYR